MNTNRTVKFSKHHVVDFQDKPTPDIDKDLTFMRLFEQVVDYTMTSKEAVYAMYSSVNHIINQQIPGAIVECGVWRGGSALLAGLILKERHIHDRPIYLYDTFEGMTPPTEFDVDKYGRTGAEMIEQYADETGWCYASLENVKQVFDAQQFDFETHFIKGDVVQTLETEKPDHIALLRLDTDFYESTRAEFEHLYPRLTSGGILIIDDYGCWAGSRKATDEYFQDVPAPMLIRIDKEVRLAVRV